MAVSFDSLGCGSQSGIEESLRLVVTSKADFEALWARHTSIYTPPEPVPDVDFDTDAVLCVFLGRQGSGGYGIRVAGVQDAAERLVTVESSAPPAGAITTCALTQPFHLVRLKRTALPVRFVEQAEVKGKALGGQSFLLTAEEGVAARLREVAGVTEVVETFDGAVLLVKMEVRSTTEAQKFLEAFEGVKSVELDG